MPIDMAFAALVRDRADALFVPPNPLFISRRFQIVQLAARHAVPATYSVRDFAEPGGLTSYGTNTADAWKESKLRSDYQNKKQSSIESKNVTPKEASGKMLQSDLSSSYFIDQTLLRPRTAIPPAALSHPSRPPYPSLQ